ncbi:MAG: iron-sulfur cluster carrier protein ApbC [Pseudomonadales bacterium]|nr:iron-sulfur cluster carrier protein ApbC [Pseudomonadales bacterium]
MALLHPYRRNLISQSNGPQKFNLPGIKHVIAVASGKGGVGKSTVSANLALALSAEGHTVGLLDADIYGPSQGLMMGIPSGTKPEISGEFFQPIVANKIQMMSMSFVTSDRTPAVWRGPMASGALQQLLTQTYWQNVEYLIVDMPPGTGDIQLTMAQNVPMSGALIVTTPQDIALLDARKAIEMFRKVEVPLLGIVENMSMHTCSECGHKEAIFGSGGGDSVASEYETKMLARLPLAMSIREQSDGGKPPVVSDPDGEIAHTFRDLARQIHEMIDGIQKATPTIKFISD